MPTKSALHGSLCSVLLWYIKSISHRIHGAAIYGNIYHQYIPFMLAYIPAPWILWVFWWQIVWIHLGIYISCTIFFRSPCFQVQPPPRKVGKQHALVRFNWHTNIPRFEWFAIWIAILEYTSFLEPLLQLFQWQYYCLYTIIFNTLW